MAGSVDDVSHKEETCGFLEAVCAFWGSSRLNSTTSKPQARKRVPDYVMGPRSQPLYSDVGSLLPPHKVPWMKHIHHGIE